MEEDFIPYEEARLMKGLGFNKECMRYHWENSDKMMGTHSIPKSNSQLTDMSTSSLKGLEGTVFMSAPLYQQAFRWFRKEHGLQKSICPSTEDGGFYFFFHEDITTETKDVVIEGREPTHRHVYELNGLYTGFKTYEEAELTCLRKLIEIVKEK